MKSSKQPRETVADEQAALWAARLDGDNLDRAQRTELDSWLAQDPAHRALLSEYCQFSADLEEKVPALVDAGSLTLPASAEPRARRRWKWNFPRLAGATLAAAAVVAVSVALLRPTPEIENVAMAPAQRGAPRTLADGTRVELNANTSLRFENTAKVRRVRLSGGEVLFAVAKDPTRPFIVETPAGSVRVTGTTFNVRADPARHAFEVTVVEGSVQVRPGEVHGGATSAPIRLGSGDQFSTAGGVRPLSPQEIEDALAWRQGIVVFSGAPVSEAAARFAQYHECAIHVAPEVANERVGGRHKIEDLNGFLAGLELALPRVKIQRELSGAVSVSLRPR
jgi:transmembrane sensor